MPAIDTQAISEKPGVPVTFGSAREFHQAVEVRVRAAHRLSTLTEVWQPMPLGERTIPPGSRRLHQVVADDFFWTPVASHLRTCTQCFGVQGSTAMWRGR